MAFLTQIPAFYEGRKNEHNIIFLRKTPIFPPKFVEKRLKKWPYVTLIPDLRPILVPQFEQLKLKKCKYVNTYVDNAPSTREWKFTKNELIILHTREWTYVHPGMKFKNFTAGDETSLSMKCKNFITWIASEETASVSWGSRKERKKNFFCS
jgi:hypothetical protein